jgi:uncharacterized MnhB-related membrane protein
MSLLRGLLLVMIALSGTGVALTRDPLEQVMAASFMGMLLTVFFTVFHAPDVALSQLVVGALALPLMVVLALSKVRRGGK